MELQQETKTPDCESAPFLSSEDLSFDAFIEVETGASSSSSSISSDWFSRKFLILEAHQKTESKAHVEQKI